MMIHLSPQQLQGGASICYIYQESLQANTQSTNETLQGFKSLIDKAGKR